MISAASRPVAAKRSADHAPRRLRGSRTPSPPLFRGVRDQLLDEKVRKGTAGRDGVKALFERRKAVSFNQRAGAQFVLNHYLGHQSHRPKPQRKNAQHRHVIHLRRDERAKPGLVEHQIEGRAHFAFEAREKHLSLSQIFGKTERRAASHRTPHQAHLLLGQQMTVVSGLGIAPHGLVGQNNVHFVVAKLRHQFPQRPRPQNELNIASAAERLDKLPLKVARQSRDSSHAQDRARPRRLMPQGIDQFVACPKDRVRVLKRQPPGFGQLELRFLRTNKGWPRLSSRWRS